MKRENLAGPAANHAMKRFDCLKILAAEARAALVVTSAGAATLEWNALRPDGGNFRVRTLGLCSSIALGMALGLPHRKVVALDGDGSLLMNLCSLPTIARMQPNNLIHIVFDNQVYEASGSRETATARGTDLVRMAAAAGIEHALWADSPASFAEAVSRGLREDQLTFIGVKVDGSRAEVPAYPIDEVENKYRFIRHIEKTEGIEILKTSLPASYS
jgi:thiamine pyrophosphate-dependent acetolactate synthase large subunit-like protein